MKATEKQRRQSSPRRAVAGTRDAILAAAGRRLREMGLHGIGVDGLLASAGLTSGAFYAQFHSKAELFREVVVLGLSETKARLMALREDGGPDWFVRGVLAYLDKQHYDDVGSGCVLPTLAADVGRSDVATRKAFERGVRELVDEIAASVPARDGLTARQSAWVTLALASGSMMLARAVANPQTASEILAASRELVQRWTHED